ncbi:hypothetical protein AOLI_G00150850 [Acnodon oligacanthus]
MEVAIQALMRCSDKSAVVLLREPLLTDGTHRDPDGLKPKKGCECVKALNSKCVAGQGRWQEAVCHQALEDPPVTRAVGVCGPPAGRWGFGEGSSSQASRGCWGALGGLIQANLWLGHKRNGVILIRRDEDWGGRLQHTVKRTPHISLGGLITSAAVEQPTTAFL